MSKKSKKLSFKELLDLDIEKAEKKPILDKLVTTMKAFPPTEDTPYGLTATGKIRKKPLKKQVAEAKAKIPLTYEENIEKYKEMAKSYKEAFETFKAVDNKYNRDIATKLKTDLEGLAVTLREQKEYKKRVEEDAAEVLRKNVEETMRKQAEEDAIIAKRIEEKRLQSIIDNTKKSKEQIEEELSIPPLNKNFTIDDASTKLYIKGSKNNTYIRKLDDYRIRNSSNNEFGTDASGWGKWSPLKDYNDLKYFKDKAYIGSEYGGKQGATLYDKDTLEYIGRLGSAKFTPQIKYTEYGKSLLEKYKKSYDDEMLKDYREQFDREIIKPILREGGTGRINLKLIDVENRTALYYPNQRIWYNPDPKDTKTFQIRSPTPNESASGDKFLSQAKHILKVELVKLLLYKTQADIPEVKRKYDLKKWLEMNTTLGIDDEYEYIETNRSGRPNWHYGAIYTTKKPKKEEMIKDKWKDPLKVQLVISSSFFDNNIFIKTLEGLEEKEGEGISTYKNKFNEKYGFDKDESHSIEEIAEITGYDLDGLKTIYDKGVGAYHTNPQSVRPQVKSAEQWAIARIYSAVMGGKSANIDKSHLVKSGGKLGRDELKGLLDASYDGRAKVGDWTIDKQLSTKTSKVYSKGDRAVVAHRGTEGITDWGNNLAFALGGEYLYKKTDRYKEAEAVQKKAEKKYGAKNVTTIGHSQGGLQAELLGSKSKEIITLNKATHPLIKRHSGNQTDIRSDRDIVSIATKTPTTEIKAESYNPLTEHSPDILNRVSADTEYGSGIKQFSNPTIAKKNAIKYLGKNVIFKISNKKGKKYMVFNPNTDKFIHFGALNYEDFTKHQDPIRQNSYLKRTANMKGDWKDDKYSANNLAREILWR